jgi:hypothetical protein
MAVGGAAGRVVGDKNTDAKAKNAKLGGNAVAMYCAKKVINMR